jgi:hypothetical protein
MLRGYDYFSGFRAAFSGYRLLRLDGILLCLCNSGKERECGYN